MTQSVEIDFCSLGYECKIEFDIMWGGYECHSCNKIGWLGLTDQGKSALYNDPKAANNSYEKYKHLIKN
jgi:hypothetical protein